MGQLRVFLRVKVKKSVYARAEHVYCTRVYTPRVIYKRDKAAGV